LLDWHRIETVIGIDQTGAVLPNGKPKPLYACVLKKTKGKPKLFPNLKLSQLNECSIKLLIDENKTSGATLVIVDSVLGLPAGLNADFQKLLKVIKNYTFSGQSYGSKTAVNFFHTFLSPDQIKRAEFPRRVAEELSGANSVFTLRPYQRNIGCGSYRVLKDLAEDSSWFNVWPFEDSLKKEFVIAEGYPSLYWREILGCPSRQSDKLNAFLKKNFQYTSLPKTSDDSDAAIIAVAGLHYLQAGFFNDFSSSQLTKKEGWIVGLAQRDKGVK
jgi:hypothetical protein